MKPFFAKYASGRVLGSLLFLATLILLPVTAMGTQPLFLCTSNVFGNPPQVDATSFYNSGLWLINTTLTPYETANTLNYTNVGTMIGSVGWEFDFGAVPNNGGRSPSASFLNDNGALIEADDGIIANPTLLYTFPASYLRVSATNLVNKGTLVAGNAGEIVLSGENVNLSRSILEIGGISPSCSQNFYTTTNFSPDTAIYDEDWITNGLTMDVRTLWNGTNARSPFFTVDEPCGLTNVPAPVDPLRFTNISDIHADSLITNGPIGTNGLPSQIFYQAVFVYSSDPNITAADTFLATGAVSNLFQTVTVQLTDQLGGQLDLVDMFASTTNHVFLQNMNTTPGSAFPAENPFNTCEGPTFRPANFILSRSDCQGTFAGGTPGMGPPSASFFYNSSFSNTIVAAQYSAYGALVTNLSMAPAGSAISNLPGRIIINADNLNLNRTFITNQGSHVLIQATNLQNSAGAVIACENVSFNIGSSGGSLNVSNLISNPLFPALHGDLYAWTALWTNQMSMVSGSGTNATTNTIELDYNVLMVDATHLSSTIPVQVQDLVIQSNAANATLSDVLTVMNSFLFGGQSLTLQGSLTLGQNILNWNRSIAPSLLYFTNNGTLTIPGEAHFGDDLPNGYLAFVNGSSGSISVGGGETIHSAYFQDNGADTANNGYSVTATTGIVQNAIVFSGQNASFTIGSFQLANSLIFCQQALNLNVSTSLTDNGLADTMVCYNGFNLYGSPQSGNLAASTVLDTATGNQLIDNAWAGQDAGSSSAGTANNVAIGTLSLVAQAPSQVPTFHFYGTTGNNAMYVKTLDLTQLGATAANITSFIQIDPGMKIYFANVLPPTLSKQSTVTVLQNNFPGQFIQDANAGQSVGGAPAIVISGNAKRSGGSFVLTWNSASGSTYSVFRSHVLIPSTGWSAIVTNYPPGGAVGGPLSYTDTTATINPAFYRVMAEPPATQ